MKVKKTTDHKYIGREVPDDLQVDDTLTLDDFVIQVQFKRTLENGDILLGFPNYQIQCEA